MSDRQTVEETPSHTLWRDLERRIAALEIRVAGLAELVETAPVPNAVWYDDNDDDESEDY